ncbi:MAG: hypothetical protein ACI8P3_002892 [Saprospiraceae bacterium]|jgi:hypothetical protein
MFKYTKHQLKKIEGLLEVIGYTIRYERGNFQSGYAIVEDRKIAVINKFFDTEARINSLFDIISNIEIDESQLDDKSLEYYNVLTNKVISERDKAEVENPA